MTKLKIFQGGEDGFGHQLEGMLRLISLSLNKKADYQYNYVKNYKFEHDNLDKVKLIKYISIALNILSDDKTEIPINYSLIKNEKRTINEIINTDSNYENNLYLYDGVGNCHYIPSNFESNEELEPSLPLLRTAFVERNPLLPKPSYGYDYTNVCCHIRLGDAVNTRLLDNENLYNVIRFFQKQKDKYCVTIHSDGDIDHLAAENTYLKEKNTDVLNVLSDFINADILIMNYSGLSISAHLLAKKTQQVIIPDRAPDTFYKRVLKKCDPCSKFLKKYTI